MCKQCCIANNGCNLRDHNPVQSQRQQLRQVVATQPFPYSSQPATPPSASLSFPSLDSETWRSLELLTKDNPTVNLIRQGGVVEEEERIRKAHKRQFATQEEADYQRAIANSLGVPYLTPYPASSSSLGVVVTENAVRTLPYCPPKITQHLNNDWMRPTKADSKTRRVPLKDNPDNRFTIIFWGKVRDINNIILCKY